MDKSGDESHVRAEEVVRAAGGIVVRAGDHGGFEVAVVYRFAHGDWSLPKGKVEPGEELTECALREVAEETGYRCELGRLVGEVEYRDRRDRRKVVSYWLMEPVEGSFVPSEEVSELRWVPVSKAPELLTYERDRELVAAAVGSDPASTA